MVQIILWEPMEVFLWGVAITILFLSAGIYLYRGKQRENFKERVILYGFALYFLGSAISGIFTFIYIFRIPGVYNNFVIYGDFDYLMTNPLLLFLANISLSSILIGTAGFIFSFEFIIKRTE